MRDKHLLGGHFLTPNCVVVRKIISICLACAGAQEKKGSEAGRQEGKQSQEVYISRMYGATPSKRISFKLGICVRRTDRIQRAKFYRYNLRGIRAVRC